MADFFHPPLFDAPARGNPVEFVGETYPAKTGGMGLPYGENFIILSSTIFCMIHPCDRRTDGRAIAYSALSIYAICCRALKMTRFILQKAGPPSIGLSGCRAWVHSVFRGSCHVRLSRVAAVRSRLPCFCRLPLAVKQYNFVLPAEKRRDMIYQCALHGRSFHYGLHSVRLSVRHSFCD